MGNGYPVTGNVFKSKTFLKKAQFSANLSSGFFRKVPVKTKIYVVQNSSTKPKLLLNKACDLKHFESK